MINCKPIVAFMVMSFCSVQKQSHGLQIVPLILLAEAEYIYAISAASKGV